MALIRALTGSSGGGSGDYTVVDSFPTSSHYSSTYTISNMAGKKLLILVCDWTGSRYDYDRYDGATASDGSVVTKLTNIASTSTYVAGTFYQVNVATNSCTMTVSTNATWDIFEAV